jgi:hypothetical protein
MTLYTVVDEGYNVDVYTTQKALVSFILGNKLRLEQDGETPSAAEVRSAVKKLDYVLYLYDEEGERSDWKFRVEIQRAVNIG